MSNYLIFSQLAIDIRLLTVLYLSKMYTTFKLYLKYVYQKYSLEPKNLFSPI